MVKKHEIHHFSTERSTKPSVVDRFNLTLKRSKYSYFTARNTYQNIDVLSEFVEGYNHHAESKHMFEASNEQTKGTGNVLRRMSLQETTDVHLVGDRGFLKPIFRVGPI